MKWCQLLLRGSKSVAGRPRRLGDLSHLTLLVLVGLFFTPSQLLAQLPGPSGDAATSDLSRSFKCPEDYSSEETKGSALRVFLQAYAAKFPANNVRDVMIFRYRLLVAHSCIQTLKSMLADVSPISEIIFAQGGDYGPKTQEFDPETKVWTVHFRRDGQPPALSEEELIFNFYGWKPATSPSAIAQAFANRRDNVKILGKFGAPDDITKNLAYFIVSEALYPGEQDGYVYISKISSVGSSAYAVTFSKRLPGKNVEENARAWYLSDEGQAMFRAVSHMGVDSSWEDYFSRPNQ